jgi:hypothetical protein
MPDVPYPITAETQEELKSQFFEMLRQLFEDKIGGLDLGDVFINSGDILSLNLVSTGALEKLGNALQVQTKSDGGIAKASAGVYVLCKTSGGLATDANGLYLSSTGGANFAIISCPAGTNPVADIVGDTLTLSAGSGLDITGTAASDTVAFALNAAAQAAVTASHARSHSVVGTSDHTFPVTVQTTTYSATAANYLIVCNSTTAFTVNLPAATGSGCTLRIKNINTGVITVDGASAETIDGIATQTLGQFDSITIVDYAAGVWVII